MTEHVLKTDPEVFDASARGMKTYELRYNDRGYLEGDTLRLRETKQAHAQMRAGAPLEYTGREIEATVTHVLYGPIYGLMDGWAILSIVVTRIRALEVTDD